MTAKIGPALPGVTTVELDGRALIQTADRREVLALNQTASDVWWLADGENDLHGIVTVLAQRYHTTPEAIGADVGDVLRTFADARLIASFDRQP
jgi:hypothetical protein